MPIERYTIVVLTLVCDGCPNKWLGPQQVTLRAATWAAAWRIAKIGGWKRKGDKVYCSRCAEDL